jgi:hypothetical protein
MVMSEDEGSPWPQLSAELGLGFKDKESTVILFSGWSDFLTDFGPTLNDLGTTPAQIKNPDILARYLTCVAQTATALTHPTQGLLYMISPGLANEFSKAGYTRKDIQKWIYENTVAPWGKVKQQPWANFPIRLFKPAALATSQGKNLPLYKQENFAPNMPDDALVKYFTAPEVIYVLVGPASPLPQARTVIMNQHPTWTVGVDKWR